MCNTKGYVNLALIVLLVLVVLGVGAFVKSYFSKGQVSQVSEYSFRFDTVYGGKFDLSYPETYFAGQDYHTKVTSFKLNGCGEKCETLNMSIPTPKLSDSQEYSVAGKDYTLQKKNNSDGTTVLVLNPKWTDKLGSIEIVSYQNVDEPSEDFKKIIGSIKFVQEIPISEIQVSPPVAVTPKSSLNPSAVPVQSSNQSPISMQYVNESKPASWKTYEDNQVKIDYPESWQIRVDDPRIGKPNVVSVHDPSAMVWQITRYTPSGTWVPTKFINFNSYDKGTNEIYHSADNYLNYSANLYDGRGAKQSYLRNGNGYGFYQIGNIDANFIIVSNGKSITGSIAKKTFETLVVEGFDTKHEEIRIIRLIELK